MGNLVNDQLVDNTVYYTTDTNYINLIADDNNSIYCWATIGNDFRLIKHRQSDLAFVWNSPLITPAANAVSVGIARQFGFVYAGFTDVNGLHLYKFNRFTGAIIDSVTYQPYADSEINTHGGIKLIYGPSYTYLDYETQCLNASGQGIFIGGTLNRPGTVYGKECFLIKYDKDFNLKWEKTYNRHYSATNNNDQATKIKLTENSVYLCGQTQKQSNGEWDGLLIKYDLKGNMLFTKILDKGSTDNCVDADENVIDSITYACLNTNINIADIEAICIYKIKPDGKLGWNRTYLSSEGFEPSYARTIALSLFVCSRPDPIILVAGTCTDDFFPWYGTGSNYLLLAYNETGQLNTIMDAWPGQVGEHIYVTSYASYFSQYLNSPVLAYIGTYQRFPSLSRGWDFWAYNFNSTLKENTSEEGSNKASLLYYPSPVREKLFLMKEYAEAIVSIYDINGRLIEAVSYITGDDGINTGHLPPGVYVLEIESGGTFERDKFIRQ